MALAISIRRVWPLVTALYKFLWHHKPTLDPNIFETLFRRFVVLFKIVCSKWQRCSKPPSSKPPSSEPATTGSSNEVESRDQESEYLKGADDDQIVIPLDNISCSLYPYGTALHDPSRFSQMSNASRSSHNLGIISRSRNASRFSHHVGSSDAQSPLGGGYTFTVQPTSPRRTYSMSSPELGRPLAAELHDAIIQRRPRTQPRSDSPVESIVLLSPGEISSSRDHIRPVSGSPIDQTTELPLLGAIGTSSRTHTDDLEIPELNHHPIYPAVPENFQRYDKRRRM